MAAKKKSKVPPTPKGPKTRARLGIPDVAQSPAGMSDEAVLEGTGRTWSQWVTELDARGGAARDHHGLVELVRETARLSDWWQQSVAAGYERTKGLRAVHETTAGFAASASRSFDCAVGALFEALVNGGIRARWLGASALKITLAREHTVIHATWGASRVTFAFVERASGGASLSVVHRDLANAAEVDAKKVFWTDALDRLERLLKTA